MKRHVQETGVRKWSGNDLLELQSEPLKVADSFLAQYGNCIITGCVTSVSSVSEGLVSIGGKVMTFSGVSTIEVFPVYLVATTTHSQREYGDNAVKDITIEYTATIQTSQPITGTEYIKIEATGGVRFFDLIESSSFDKLQAAITALQILIASMNTEIPTLSAVPTADTLTYTVGNKTKSFAIGQQCRVVVDSGITFYQLTNISLENKAAWKVIANKTSQLDNDDHVVKDAYYVHTENNYSTQEKQKVTDSLRLKEYQDVSNLSALPSNVYNLRFEYTSSDILPIAFASIENVPEMQEFYLSVQNSTTADITQPIPNALGWQSEDETRDLPAGRITGFSLKKEHGIIVVR